jgi:16S rRNA (uracil1498-N3)-methyltransferase
VEKLPRLTLLQAVLKHGNCDHIVREATSIGVHRLIFFDGKRSECKLATGAADRVSRWEAIAVGACKQSGNPFLPKIFHCAEISKYIEIGKYVPHNKRDEAYGVGAANFKFFGDLGEGSLPLGNILANGAPDWKQIADIFIAIGPEGDFSVNERDFLRRDGFIACRLSQNVLRSETAAIYALGVLDHLCHCHLPPLTS